MKVSLSTNLTHFWGAYLSYSQYDRAFPYLFPNCSKYAGFIPPPELEIFEDCNCVFSLA